MGYGDDIMATGLAKNLHSSGKRAAFGDGKRIIWGPWSEEMFRYNPNVAAPGSEGHRDIVWINHYKGGRLYNKQSNGKWVWNYQFKPVPGEFFFDEAERAVADRFDYPFVVIEPNVPWQKSVAVNKDWGEQNYQDVADMLMSSGHRVVQFDHKNARRKIKGNNSRLVSLSTFREVLSVLSRSKLYVGPEGGMHHGAAASEVKGVVLFGGFIPPEVTGYDMHVNLTGGAEACGSLTPCKHCLDAMRRIEPDQVFDHAMRILS